MRISGDFFAPNVAYFSQEDERKRVQAVDETGNCILFRTSLAVLFVSPAPRLAIATRLDGQLSLSEEQTKLRIAPLQVWDMEGRETAQGVGNLQAPKESDRG